MKIELKADSATREYSVSKHFKFRDAPGNDSAPGTQYTEEVSVAIDRSRSSGIVAKVERRNVRKDGKRFCPNPVEHYFIKSGEVLNKLELQLTADGKIEKVLNREEILKNWEYTRIYLDNYFVSRDENVLSTIKGWTQQIESIIKDERRYLQIVESDLLYNRFFYGYWMDYGKNGQMIVTQFFPGVFGAARTVLTEELAVSETDGIRKVEIVGYLNKEESDLAAIAETLGMKETQLEGLSVDLKGTCLFDADGMIEKIEMKADANLSDTDLQRSFSLIVSRR